MNQLPSRQQLLDWIADHPGDAARRDIARAFGIKGAQRIELKRLLKELEAEGLLTRRRQQIRSIEKLPPVTILTLLAPDRDGDQFAKPMEWEGRGPAPRVLFVPRKSDQPLAEGDRILCKLIEVEAEDHQYQARLIRKIGTVSHRIVGIFRKTAEGGRIVPIDKGADREWRVSREGAGEAQEGELVEAEQAGPRGRLGLPWARILERLGDPSAPRAVSLIAIHQHGIPDDFPDAVITQTDAMRAAPLGGREDLRDLALVTIDPEDARDHDDACLALPDPDPRNPGGFLLWVAIADVAHYVTPQSPVDREARSRGNSTYFPDRVVPMLPDHLSGDLCSLHEGLDRACIAVCMTIDAEGRKIAHRFTRALMRSVASLTYEEAQAAQDGQPSPRAAALIEPVITPLYACYAALRRARERRQPLDLDLPERRIVLSDEGKVVSVKFKERLDAHRLIEEFMVLANVAAAEELERLRRPLLYRVHEEPSPEKLNSLREVAEASGFTLAKGQVLHTRHLNALLAQAQNTDFDELINLTALRSMTQAYYHPQNLGHFGLALRSYAHFTSPIRRYSDLIVHRALIAGHGWAAQDGGAKGQPDGLSPADIEMLDETATHISDTERRSMAAERDTTDRYLAAFLADRVGGEFAGRISGVTRFGLFVRLDETGADGLVPIRTLGREFFHYDADSQTLMGADTGTVIGLGQRVLVRLAEAVPVTGGLMLDLLELDGAPLGAGPRGPRGGKGGGKGAGARPRRPAAEKARSDGIKRKVLRKRR